MEKKRTKNTRIYIKRKKRSIDRSIFSKQLYRTTSASISRGIVLLSNNVDDEELSDHRRVPPRVPLSDVCRSMAPEHVGCRDTRENPARGVGKERRRERERDLDVDSSATAWTIRLGDKKRTARRDAVSED